MKWSDCGLDSFFGYILERTSFNIRFVLGVM